MPSVMMEVLEVDSDEAAAVTVAFQEAKDLLARKEELMPAATLRVHDQNAGKKKKKKEKKTKAAREQQLQQQEGQHGGVERTDSSDRRGERSEAEQPSAMDQRRLMNPSCSLALGIACRGGKISGQEVMDIPSGISVLASRFNANSVTIEVLPPHAWTRPRREPEGVTAPVVLIPCVASEAQGQETATTLVAGGPDLRPCAPGKFANVDTKLQVTSGYVVQWHHTQHPAMAVGASSHERILISLRCIADTHIPRSVVARRTRERQRQLTAVIPVAQQSRQQEEDDEKKKRGEEGKAEGDEAAARTPALEQEHVVNVYETIAVHWDKTRHSAWPKVADFLATLPVGALVADVGCGNGKYMGIRDDICVIGCDRSVNLSDLCARQGFEVSICDNMVLGFTPSAFDAILSIAVLHHFSSAARRRRAMAEMAALLVPGGSILVQAWALQQGEESRRVFPSQDVFVPWQHKGAEEEIPPEQQLTATQRAQPISGPQDETPVYHRYCHVFTEGELDRLAESVGLEVVHSDYDKSNWCIHARKPAQTQPAQGSSE